MCFAVVFGVKAENEGGWWGTLEYRDCTKVPTPANLIHKTSKVDKMSQLMRLWYLSHRQPAKAQASLRIRAVLPEPLLFAHIKHGSKRRAQPKIRHLAPLDGCACVFKE